MQKFRHILVASQIIRRDWRVSQPGESINKFLVSNQKNLRRSGGRFHQQGLAEDKLVFGAFATANAGMV
jgi:hypothetical protein